MNQVQSFEPVIGTNPRVIILGSMPGVASLEAVQYYAHPRNAFWPIMEQLFGIDVAAEYALRIEQIARQPLILWDTLRSCHRPGSLDSSIDMSTVQANDFPGVLDRYSRIRAICFNGAASADYFKKLVLNQIDTRKIEMLRLPSTSPANATMNFEQKLAAWRQILDFVE